MDYEHRNAVIRDTFLGVEDHGIFTFNLTLDYGGSGQGAGNYTLQSSGHTAPNGFWLLRKILGTVGVDSWEKLRGQHVVALIEGGLVRGLAPFLLDGPPVVFSEVLGSEVNSAAPKLLRPGGPITGSTWDGYYLNAICRNCGRAIRFNPQEEPPTWRHLTSKSPTCTPGRQ